MFDMLVEVAPPCITGHVPADFTVFSAMVISCRGSVTDTGGAKALLPNALLLKV
jgi:hypothetical protein